MSLDELKQQRANTKKNISRIKNIVDASLRPGGKTLSAAEYKCRLGILESYFKQQIIDKEYSLSNIEKFNHLRNSLQGQALETVDAFQVTNENYPKALERLKARYDNKTLIFLENISSLFELPAVSKPNALQLRSLIDKASAIYGSLLSLGSDRHIVLQKSDEQTNRKWKESLDFKTLPTWDDCVKVLERNCQYLESIDNASGFQGTSKATPNKARNQAKGYSFSCSSTPCSVCSSPGHKVASCDRFKTFNTNQRFEHAKKMGLCINCLSKGHQMAQCPSSHRCKVCSKQHHSLLHRGSPPAQQATNSLSSARDAAVHTHMQKSSADNIILATAKILVRDSSGDYRLGKALLDSWSQVNFITEEISQKLSLPKIKENIEIQGIGKSSIKYKTSTNIKSQFKEFELPLTLCITPHIAYHPDPEIDVSSWNIPNNIALADDEFFVAKKIDLLLGTETFFSLLAVGQIKLGTNLPILQKTLLGWVVSGRYQSNNKLSQCSYLFTANDSLDAKLEKLWKIEEVAVNAEPWTREQTTCENLYKSTVSRNPAGRIIVKLPFKDDPSCLGDSYTTALRRFNSQERRLAKSPQLREQYVSSMDEYERLGHMSVVQIPNLNEPHYYIHHHCVLKPSSTTTKLRVVFDASCRTTTQKSLNDIQMVQICVDRRYS
ncbi:PREDICTED: uncharacterized protein LOC108375630 [Rhagoletis zephyria]|uniref:uncharacterized protein LOC108375630 n=1 Tax=Rhagoletis zephyria TaxID=28612 RepID=UPI00081187CA|nr:PREDICTED: uncharacterized protein LOC108375630 [Rhagoletis zephyria]